jgi:hypothetical protein
MLFIKLREQTIKLVISLTMLNSSRWKTCEAKSKLYAIKMFIS